MNFFHEHLTTLQKASIGIATPIGSTILSLIPHIETGLRIAGLVAGLCVSVAAFTSIIYDVIAKHRKQKGKK